MEQNQLLTMAEVADIFRVSKQAIRTWTNSGKLPCIRTPGGHRRFRREDVEKMISGGDDEKMVDH